MGTDIRTSLDRLIANFKENPATYSMFYAIYLAEALVRRWYPEQNVDKLEQKGIEFHPYPHYTFYPSSIRGFRYEEKVMTFVINLFGLYGPDSPLPRCYHEQVSIQQNVYGEDQVPLQSFLDIFNNRFYWLYYQAWKKYRFYLQLTDDPNNRVLQRLFAFIGQGPQFVKQTPSINAYKLLQLSGILSLRTRNKKGLLILLQEFFPAFKIKIQEFVPSMIKVDKRPLLGSKNGELSFRLGNFSLVGDSVLNYTSRIRIEMGPMDFDTYLEFLPSGRHTRLLKELLALYLNDALEYELRCRILSSTIHNVSWQDERVKLGQSFWLGRPKEACVQVDFK